MSPDAVRAVTGLPCNARGELAPDVLATALESAPQQPTIVVLHAGDLNIGAFDPMTFIAVTAFLALAATLASWIPARRAIHVDPMTALRCE